MDTGWDLSQDRVIFGIAIVFISCKSFAYMKNVKLLAALVLSSTAVAATVYVIRKRKREKRLVEISNAGYELAYDIQYPVRYKS